MTREGGRRRAILICVRPLLTRENIVPYQLPTYMSTLYIPIVIPAGTKVLPEALHYLLLLT